MPNRPPFVAVVDDDPKMCIALSRLLRARGFRVVYFTNGTDFISANPANSFDCVLLDLHMPVISGFDVMAELAKRSSHPPVVAITAQDAHGNAQRLRSLGIAEYLLKPVDQGVLLAAIERATQATEP